MADGQDPNANDNASNANPEALKAQVRAELEAEFDAKYRGMLEAARDEAAGRRKKVQEKDAEIERLAAEQGQYKTAYEKAQERLQELEASASGLTEKMGALETKAQAWDQYQANALEAIEARKGSLPDVVAAQLDAVSDLTAKQAILSVFDATSGGVKVSKTASADRGGGPITSPGTPIGVNPSVADLQRLKETDPDAFRKAIGVNGQQKAGFWSRWGSQ